ncbi:MAG: hypothetical protein A2623_07755 [Caulobacterales bacterium RIFCSPHIGHO2_01_FULL_70_19]|nr:MAG: hypothetical protein A2623_07755 [Caulobacterales bacterium RIFCSPHIGHO2_01_FULL_70_19]
MRIRDLLPVLVLTAALAACASTPPPAEPIPPQPEPAPVEGYDWILHEDGADARLAYGVAESDDVRIAFDCRRGEGRLAMAALAPPDAEPVILLESGGETGRYAAAPETDLIHDGLILSAAAEADEPVFQRFRRVAWLARWQGGQREAYVPHAGSAGRIEQFFAFCG